MFLKLCAPALIYLIFNIVNIIFEITNGLMNTALVRVGITIIITYLLNLLCVNDMGIVSWIIVFLPFILMTYVIALLLITFRMDPETGLLPKPEELPEPDVREKERDVEKEDKKDVKPANCDDLKDNDIKETMGQMEDVQTTGF